MHTMIYPRIRPHVTDLRGVRIGLSAALISSMVMWAAILAIA